MGKDTLHISAKMGKGTDNIIDSHLNDKPVSPIVLNL